VSKALILVKIYYVFVRKKWFSYADGDSHACLVTCSIFILFTVSKAFKKGVVNEQEDI
jgi:hypothetical protein